MISEVQQMHAPYLLALMLASRMGSMAALQLVMQVRVT
jgi:hypothetical protein